MRTSPPASRKRRIIRGFLWALGVIVPLFLLAQAGHPWLLLIVFYLTLGWAIHAWRIPGMIDWNFPTLLISFAGLAATVFLVRRVIDWFAAESEKPAPATPVIVRITLIVICICGAAISLSGIIHQAVWLAGKPLTYGIGRLSTWQHQVTSNVQTTLKSLKKHAAAHGEFPRFLSELSREDSSTASALYYQISEDPDSLEPLVYLRPGQPLEELPPETPVLIAPRVGSLYAVIGCANGTVSLTFRSRVMKDHPQYRHLFTQP